MKATITKSKATAAVIASIPTPEDGRLCIRATPDGVFAVSETYAGVHVEPIPGEVHVFGDAWVSGAKLAAIVKLADHDVVLDGPVRDSAARGPHHRITSGRYRAIVSNREAGEFGLLDRLPATLDSGWVESSDLRNAVAGIRQVAESKAASAHDAARGVMFEAADGVMRLVTTDGHRMAVSEIPADLNLRVTVIVPEGVRDLLSWLSHRSGAVYVQADETMLWLRGGGAVFGYRVKSGTYLDWRKLWSKASKQECVIDGASLKRARQSFAGLETQAVRFAMDAESASLKTVGAGDEAEVHAGDGTGESGSVTLDPLYLAAANDLSSGPLRVAWPAATDAPVLFRGDVCAHLVMPKRA